ncbi:MAG: endonuclease/exonuclease/phosphatase family protein [Oligoflexia bacterium]|nr:endonuclease/exonuclease/phosphatase family protein [Oligoflexia bacterium]
MAPAHTISIQTLNVYGSFYAKNKKDRKNAILQFLKNESSDINFFQEVWFESDYQNIKRTSESIGLKSISYDFSSKYKKRSGLVTVIKGDIYKKDFHFFPQGKHLTDFIYDFLNINKGFGAIYTKLLNNSNRPLVAVNIHLHHLSQKARLFQLIYYLRWFLNKSVLNHPIIFAGDFNFEPDSLEFEMIKYIFRLKEPQTQLNLPYSCTVCKENKYFIGYNLSKMLLMDYERTIDYIFFRSSSTVRLTPKSFSIFPKKYHGVSLSDHYGVKAEIQFKPNLEPQQVNQWELERRMELFLKTLDKVQHQISRKSFSSYDITPTERWREKDNQKNKIQFLESLRNQLKTRDALLIQHLSQN